MLRQIIKTLLLAGITGFIAFAILTVPDQASEASIRGLSIWWESVFPTLLPFFIIAELLISFGVVSFIGVLCEPIMRPIFNVPGVGSFAWTMGMVSGYPTGAKISVHLRQEEQISQIEGERLVAFTNASSPLFIIGVIAGGLFNDPKLGLLLIVCHYIGNTLVGICMRFYGRSKKTNKQSVEKKVSLKRAFHEMHQTRMSDPRPFGQVMGDAVINSVKTLVMVGGFIILFSVFTKLLYILNISPAIASVLKHLFQFLTLPVDLALPFLSGIFEITLGSQMLSNISIDNLLAQMVIVSFILGFHGLSVQAQVSSIIAKTDIRFAPYFFARFLHAVFASILTVLLYNPLYVNRQAFELKDIPVSQEVQQNSWYTALDLLKHTGPLITILFLGIAVLLLYRRKQAKK
ncbi:sporulation integral membrane protein YlbJ [Lentibacillus sp. Marseille-P4043]|uniref:sporulation integral membrane protein YlbJ n=1 Tax=Lentibacillus sp. Marseille-P4043 TaxID=2040293 RepID=UPI000D0B271A|nr:sporulation integral membrane protein YlbJ [Lentibacillus sp. Marseille-P4043]